MRKTRQTIAPQFTTVKVSQNPPKWEVRKGEYLAGIVEGFGFDDIPSYRAFGRAYGLRPMSCLGNFGSLATATSSVTSLS